MSSDTEEVNEEEPRCASCGVTQGDDTKLMKCTACHLVRYCSDECQKEHRPKHKRQCKKRVAESRDERLFRQPESSHLGDCPICCLPLSIDLKKSFMYDCCSKAICNGCTLANQLRAIEMRLRQSCPFCREPVSKNDAEHDKQRMKRVEANDPVAIRREGLNQKGEYTRSFEYLSKAADLGDVESHYKLAYLYQCGEGVEEDKGKEIYHLEKAAIGGHPDARYELGVYEWDIKENAERAMKHWIIAATQGQDESTKMLMAAFKKGYVEKADLDSALRAHHAAVDATKSPQREAADKYYGNNPDS